MIKISEETKSVYAYGEVNNSIEDEYRKNGYNVVRFINGNTDINTALTNVIKSHI